VITNETQYEESDGILLKKHGFGGLAEITWPAFANKLQRHFLRAARQDPMKPTRFLTSHELDYFHQKFFGGAPMISQTHFDTFWQWFGKGLQKLRYQRHVCSMWQSGLIFGFISREAVEEALRKQEVGSFIIRFSERHPGLFVIGYKINDEVTPIRHYLIRPEDTSAKKTLPDFLHTYPDFIKILQVTIDANGDPRLTSFAKDVVLGQYYAKITEITRVPGYVTSNERMVK